MNISSLITGIKDAFSSDDPFVSPHILQARLHDALVERKGELGIFQDVRTFDNYDVTVKLIPNTRGIDPDFVAKMSCIIIDCGAIVNGYQDEFKTAVHFFEHDDRVLSEEDLYSFKYIDEFRVKRLSEHVVLRSATCGFMLRIFNEPIKPKKFRELTNLIIGFAQDITRIAHDWRFYEPRTSRMTPEPEQLKTIAEIVSGKTFQVALSMLRR